MKSNWKELSLDDEIDKSSWDFIYSKLGFNPKFKINRNDIFERRKPDCVIEFLERFVKNNDNGYDYDLYNKWNGAIKSALGDISNNQEIYALDWQHVSFKFNPCESFLQNDFEQSWPVPAYPDGDHIFFLTPDYKNIYFGHAFDEYVMLFGDDLVGSVLKHIESSALSDKVKITMEKLRT